MGEGGRGPLKRTLILMIKLNDLIKEVERLHISNSNPELMVFVEINKVDARDRLLDTNWKHQWNKVHVTGFEYVASHNQLVLHLQCSFDV